MKKGAVQPFFDTNTYESEVWTYTQSGEWVHQGVKRANNHPMILELVMALIVLATLLSQVIK